MNNQPYRRYRFTVKQATTPLDAIKAITIMLLMVWAFHILSTIGG